MLNAEAIVEVDITDSMRWNPVRSTLTDRDRRRSRGSAGIFSRSQAFGLADSIGLICCSQRCRPRSRFETWRAGQS